MADDLDDNWYIQEKIEDNEDEVEEDENTNGSLDGAVNTSKKRKLSETEDVLITASGEPSKKKKKKSKKKKKTSLNEEMPLTSEALWNYFEVELKKTLSELEMSELVPHDNWFLEEKEPRESNTSISKYLNSVISYWKKDCENFAAKEKKSSPLMLIVCPGAQRAADVLRETKEFRGKDCKCIKLFAKHLKLSDQKKFLKKDTIHLGVGTPHRISKLIDEGALSMSKLKYVVVDWKWKDVKNRQIFNMPSVKDDFLKLFEKHILPYCKKKQKLKIGLY